MKRTITDPYKLILFFLYLFSISLSNAQETIVSYVTKNGGRTAHQDSAEYISILHTAPNAQGLYELNDYYKNGNLKRHGWVKTLDPIRLYLEGLVETYYDHGTLEATVYYTNNQRIDTAHRYYKNGVLQEVKIYLPLEKGQKRHPLDGSTKRLLYHADSTGQMQVQDGYGELEIIHNEIDRERGRYAGGHREGRWEGTFQKGKYRYEEWYENGKVVRGMTTDSTDKKYPYEQREISPIYPGGIPNLVRFISQNYQCPKEAGQAKVIGQLRIRFVVDTTGNMTDFDVVHDLGYGTAAAGIDALRKAERWSPGYQRGVPVRVAYTIPIMLRVTTRPQKESTATP